MKIERLLVFGDIHGKWEKFLSDMASQRDEAERARKSDRFMSGIRRFSVFLVDAAKSAPADVRFEREAPGQWRRGRSSTGTKRRTSRPKT